MQRRDQSALLDLRVKVMSDERLHRRRISVSVIKGQPCGD